VVVIADSSKLGGHAFARICPITKIETLVTDSGARPPRGRASARRCARHHRVIGDIDGDA
jgi:DeoR/GlpR family transcriptional regulator of sugar metabolism